MKTEHIAGKDSGKVMLYALSTCPWCRKAKQLLGEMGIAYDYVDVDLLAGKERDETLDKIRVWNPACSFPTLVINDKKCIVGFKESEIPGEPEIMSDIPQADIGRFYERLKREAEAGGYHLNPDIEFSKSLVAGLLTNEQRYGYQACPCRLASGKKEEDLDIICPCDYRDADLLDYDTCY